VGAGIDLATGTTTYAICHSEEILRIPDSDKIIAGLQIPAWEEVLALAIKAQEATGLGYLGADIVLQPSIKHPGKTIPKVLELNAQPGLKIQLCNKDGLRRRLERIEGLEVKSAEHGIRIAQELFGERKVVNSLTKEIPIKVFEEVEVEDSEGHLHKVPVKVDTGAFRTSIDTQLAREFGLLNPDNILMTKSYESALGETEREVVGITFTLAGKKLTTSASVADRSKLKRPMLIGRRDLSGFTIKF
jgi:hypothetical protein